MQLLNDPRTGDPAGSHAKANADALTNGLQLGYIRFYEALTGFRHHCDPNNVLPEDRVGGPRPPSETVYSPFHSTTLPSITIENYVKRLYKHSLAGWETFLATAVLIERHCAETKHEVTLYNFHRLLVASLVIAVKAMDDRFFEIPYYAQMGGIPVTELNTLTLSFLGTISWRCFVDKKSFILTRNFFFWLAGFSDDMIKNYFIDTLDDGTDSHLFPREGEQKDLRRPLRVEELRKDNSTRDYYDNAILFEPETVEPRTPEEVRHRYARWHAELHEIIEAGRGALDNSQYLTGLRTSLNPSAASYHSAEHSYQGFASRPGAEECTSIPHSYNNGYFNCNNSNPMNGISHGCGRLLRPTAASNGTGSGHFASVGSLSAHSNPFFPMSHQYRQQQQPSTFSSYNPRIENRYVPGGNRTSPYTANYDYNKNTPSPVSGAGVPRFPSSPAPASRTRRDRSNDSHQGAAPRESHSSGQYARNSAYSPGSFDDINGATSATMHRTRAKKRIGTKREPNHNEDRV